jgi:ketosteroid isomerase-like protein
VAAWNSGGVEATLPFYSEDTVWFPFPDAPESTTGFRGHDGVRKLMGDLTSSFESFDVATHEIRDLGDTVLWFGEMSGAINGSSVPIRQTMASVASDFRDGRIGTARFFPSWEEALEAVGLRE